MGKGRRGMLVASFQRAARRWRPIVINIIDRNENFNEQGELGWRHGPTGNKLRYTASRNHYVISTSFVQPYHVYPSVHACAPACMCTCVANPIEWNVYKHPLSLGQSFFRFFTFLPRQTTGWKHKGFPAVASCAGVSLNKNERQGLINSVVRIYVCKIRKICKYTSTYRTYTYSVCTYVRTYNACIRYVYYVEATNYPRYMYRSRLEPCAMPVQDHK